MLVFIMDMLKMLLNCDTGLCIGVRFVIFKLKRFSMHFLDYLFHKSQGHPLGAALQEGAKAKAKDRELNSFSASLRS
jgi:hypothetical protein